ncbi:hypothetical protein SLE2022_247330 [Rubroshorea leprosula]
MVINIVIVLKLLPCAKLLGFGFGGGWHLLRDFSLPEEPSFLCFLPLDPTVSLPLLLRFGAPQPKVNRSSIKTDFWNLIRRFCLVHAGSAFGHSRLLLLGFTAGQQLIVLAMADEDLDSMLAESTYQKIRTVSSHFIQYGIRKMQAWKSCDW